MKNSDMSEAIPEKASIVDLKQFLIPAKLIMCFVWRSIMSKKQKSDKSKTEEFKLEGGEIISKIHELIHEGNIRRIIIKNEEGKTLIEIPLLIGLVGAALAPVLAAVGAIGALVAKLTIIVEKTEE
jgi:hypothetical protein